MIHTGSIGLTQPREQTGSWHTKHGHDPARAGPWPRATCGQSHRTSALVPTLGGPEGLVAPALGSTAAMEQTCWTALAWRTAEDMTPAHREQGTGGGEAQGRPREPRPCVHLRPHLCSWQHPEPVGNDGPRPIPGPWTGDPGLEAASPRSLGQACPRRPVRQLSHRKLSPPQLRSSPPALPNPPGRLRR